MFDDIGSYFGYFEATPNNQVSQTGLLVLPVSEAQAILVRFGHPLVQDGLFGPKSKNAWAAEASKRRLNPTFDRVDGKTVRVHPATRLQLFNESLSKPSTSKPAAQPTSKKTAVQSAKAAKAVSDSGDLVTRSVLDLQNLLYGIGWTAKKLKKDGLFGKQTQGAWAYSAKQRGLPQTFDKVDGKNARVSNATLTRITLDAKAAPVVATKPAETAMPGAGGVQNVFSVLDLQKLLYGIGWTAKKLAMDGKFGPQTQKAWATSAGTRKIDPLFVRVDGTHARVNPATYARFVADAKSSSPVPIEKAATGADSSGSVVQPILELQKILVNLGAKLKLDGLFGKQSQGAWAAAAKKVGASPQFDRVDGKSARVSLAALNLLLAAQPKTIKTESQSSSASATGTTSISVIDAQNLLYGLGWTAKKLKKDGLYGSQTKNAWAISAKSRKLPQTFEKVDGKTARVDARTLVGFAAAAKTAAPQPVTQAQSTSSAQASGATASDKDVSKQVTTKAVAEAAKIVAKAATASIKVLEIQQALLATQKYPGTKTDGLWSKKIAADLMSLYQVQSASIPVWNEAFRKLVSKDKRAVKLLPKWTAELQALADIYRKRAAASPDAAVSASSATPEPILAPPPQDLVSMPPGGDPRSLPPPWVQQQSGGGGPAPMPVEFPTSGGAVEPPTPEQSAALAPLTPEAEDDTWQRLVATAQTLGAKAPELTAAIERASTQGTLAPETIQAYAQWVQASRAIVGRLQSLVNIPVVKQAIDATAGASPQPAPSGMADLAWWFADLSAASDEIMPVLVEPFPVVLVGGTALAYDFSQAAPVVAVAVEAAPAAMAAAARFGGALWAKLIQLLGTQTVARVGTTAVIAQQVKSAITAEVDDYAAREAQLDKLVADGVLTVEQRQALKGERPGGVDNVVIPVVLGAVALGGLAIFLKNKSQGGSHAKSRR